MKIKWLVIMILIVFGIGIALSVMIIKKNNVSEVDLVAINKVVKTVENNWGHVKEDMLTNSNLTQPFTIVDSFENVIYETSDAHFINLYEAIKNRDTVIDVRQNNEIVGKVIIQNNEQEMMDKMKNELFLSIGLIFGLIMFFSIWFILYIHRKLLIPFQKLQDFAANIARGNLDIPLDMNRNNAFGAFTESFDLMREELGIARQREYESNRSKKELVATLSHDIKTPVSTIKAVSELMIIQAKEEKVKRQINTIYSKAEQINLLITDMFHATLEELEQLQIVITEESSEILIHMFENVNYDNKIAYAPIPPCIILTDPARMQQVIDNIISNSYKYAGTGIKIHSQICLGFLEISITDSGPGISEDELPLLFNKYFRGNNVKSQNGSGLGLYISKYFMESMEGEIHCSNDNKGFTVTLKVRLAYS